MNAVALRTYQEQAVQGVEAAFAAGHRSTLIESATGTGKTTTACEAIRRHLANGGKRVLVLAHRRELLDQFRARLDSFGIKSALERGASWAVNSNAPVVVASIQTMRGPRLASWPMDSFDLIVHDESHHAVAAGHRDCLAAFPGAKILGLTATPDRADGVALGLVFESVAARYDIASAVAAGYLCPARGIRVEVPGMDLSKVRLRARKTTAGALGASTVAPGPEFTDLHPGDLGRAALAPEAVEGVAGPLVELAGSKKTIVFCVDRRHAAALTAALLARNVTAEVVHGALRAERRRTILADFAAGKIQFLVNVQLLCEGWDCPSVECVAMVRPTKSRIMWAQCAGRGLRLHPGKSECLVLDFCGVSCQFTLCGPEDALQGALVAPVVVHRTGHPSAPPAPPPYVPRSWTARFVARAVELLRRAGRRVRDASPPRVRRAAGWVARAVKLLVG